MLFQDRLAEDGIFYFLNVHQRDSMIGRNLRPAIVEGKTFDLLSKNYHLDTTVYQYLNGLLEQSEREIYPRVTLHTALYQYYAEGTDMFLPIIKGNDDNARVTGLALFKEDRYIDKLNVHEASFLNCFQNRSEVVFTKYKLAAIRLQALRMSKQHLNTRLPKTITAYMFLFSST